MQANQLKVNNISCERQETILFKHLNFQANSGEIVRILGKNGSGKSSLLKIITGLLKPIMGNVEWNQQDICLQGSQFTNILTFIGHKAAIKTELTVAENIHTLLGFSAQQKNEQSIDRVLEQLELSRFRAVQAGYLSAGQQRRIALCRLWLERTQLWVLDEPYTALDKEAVKLVDNVITAALSNGVIVIYTSHQDSGHHYDNVINIALGS